MSVDAIVETLDDMESKASGSLSDARKAESEGQQDHATLKQSLEQQMLGQSRNERLDKPEGEH